MTQPLKRTMIVKHVSLNGERACVIMIGDLVKAYFDPDDGLSAERFRIVMGEG